MVAVLEDEFLIQPVGLTLREEHLAPDQWAKRVGPLFADQHACEQGASVRAVRIAWWIVEKVFANL